jgi:hypothetical protein
MALRVISIILSVPILLCAVIGHAQENTIQSSLFENCDEVREKFSLLSPEEQTKLVDYLTRVVGLNTQAPAAPEVFAVLPGGKGMEPNQPALWQNMDAKRELRGKRCALELLTSAGPLAFDALPQLASLYSEQPLSDEIAVGIEETAATIAEQAHRNGRVPSDAVLDQVIPFLKSDRSLVAQNLLHEYLSLSLPRILTFMSNLSEEDAGRLRGFLKDADPDGGRAMRAFVELVPKLTAENANRLANYLPFPTKDATAPLLADFARLAAEPTHGNNVTSLLAKGCVALGGILIDPTLAATVARNPNLLKDGFLSETEQRCLLTSIPSMSGIILGLLTSSRDDEQNRALSLLPSALRHLDSDRENALFVKVRELANQPKSPNRNEALVALGLFSNRRVDANTALVAVLKGELSSKDPNESAAAIDAACKSADALNPPKDLSKYAPLVLDALKRGLSSPGVTNLATKIDSLQPQVTSLLSPQKPERSVDILNALTTRKTFSKDAMKDIIEALRYPALAASAESLLIAQGPSIVPQLRKTLLKSSTTQRLGIIALLEVFGSATKAEKIEILHALTSSETCEPASVRPQVTQKLLMEQDIEADLKLKLVTKVISCLCSYAPDAAKSLITSAGAALFAQPEAVQSTLQESKSCHLEGDLLAAAGIESLPENIRALILTQIIERGTRDFQAQALESLNNKHPLAQQALPSVRKLALGIKDDQPLAYQAVLALSRLGDTQFDWPHFTRDTIAMRESSPHYQMAMETIKSLPAEVVLNEVTPALDSDNPDQVAGACRVGATLGALAIPIVSKVWSLRDKRSPTIKYAAILALLEINPLTPELQDGLKAILVNRYYPAAYARPIQWRQSVAVVDSDKASFGTLRTVHLERLLLK